MQKQRKMQSHRAKALDALKRESDCQLIELIRRRLVVPVEKRLGFLRARLPGRGSAV